MSKKPAPVYTFDFETDPFKRDRLPECFCAVFFDGKNASTFWGVDCVFKLVNAFHTLGCRAPFVAYAHNGGKFDFHFMLPALCEKYGHENIKLFCVGSRIVQIKAPTFELRDSFAIIPRRLKDFGNKDAKKKEIEIGKLESDVRETHKKEIIEYCVMDCIALHEGLLSYFDTYGRKSLTLASSAARYMKEHFGIGLPSTDYRFDNKFRPFYFGGRVEFFALGKIEGDIKIVDINSAYPFAMTFPHWFSPSYEVDDKIPKENREQSLYIVECFSKGAFPYRSETPLKWRDCEGRVFRASANAVCFPHARLTYHVSGWEYFAALKLGLIRDVKILRVYTPTGTQEFSEYVKHFYHLKANAKTEGERNAAKLYLTGFYGKTSQNPRQFTEFKLAPFGASHWGEGYELAQENEKSGLGFWQKPAETDETKMRFVNVACAASITGFVRANLMKAKAACRKVYYTDTDSIIGEGIEKLDTGDKLGEWKLEAEIDRGFIGGKKLYAMHKRGCDDSEKSWKKACKGVRLSAAEIVKVAMGEEMEYAFDAPNYSPASPPRFVKRKIRRDDKRKIAGEEKTKDFS